MLTNSTPVCFHHTFHRLLIKLVECVLWMLVGVVITSIMVRQPELGLLWLLG